ncbi:MAG: FxsA family protein [Candidatus Thermoplasmatota archaeon]|nr:FxsA family protein [Candidatus Thermoplasmatota archaeon]
MLRLLLLAFVIVPLVEVYLLVQVAELIGFWNTVYLVLFTGLIGAALVRVQGPQAWRDIVLAWQQGRVPGRELLAGALFLVGAAFLLTPGVLTDGVGLLLMVPWVRKGTAGLVAGWFRRHATVVTFGAGRR